jgi:hypothetical protein
LVRRQPLFEISHGRRAQPTAPMPQVAVKADVTKDLPGLISLTFKY